MCTPKYRLSPKGRSFLMAKYSFNLKLKIVEDYLSGGGGYYFLAKKYRISHPELIHRWVENYKNRGVQGLQRKRQNIAYSTQFKLNAVSLYLTSGKSYREVSNELGMNNSPLLTRWVLDYREKGNSAFIQKLRGRPKGEHCVSKSKRGKKASELSEIEQELDRLHADNLKLRMENEYLKGVRRLRMEQQAKKNPDLFKTSTDNSSSHLNNF